MKIPKAIANYISGLEVGQGRYAGESFTLHGWQKRFLRGAFNQPGDAALSMGRGNGKTTFCAAIACAAVDVDGPLVEPMAECLLVASSFDQGLIAFRHILHFLRPSLERHRGRFRIQDSANRATIQDRDTGAMIRVLGSDPRRLHGAAPKLLLLDEVAQWPPEKVSPMLAALRTSRGKIPGSRALWLGTRPAADEHPFQRALDGHGVGFALSYRAPKEAPPFQRRTWKRANPGLDNLPDLEAMIRQEAQDARRDPSALASFRALRLNQGVSDVGVSVLVDADTWKAAMDLEGGGRSGDYVLGLDLGQNAAMSAAAGYFRTGQLEACAVFPELPSLGERGLADGVGRLYLDMASRGELMQAGRRVSDVRALLREALRRWGRPLAVVCDRWRIAELRQALEAVRFPLGAALVERGQGFKDGGQDVRDFRAAVLADQVRPERSLLLSAAMAEARAVGDPAGNWKLAKNRQGGRRAQARDDAAAAAILAVAEGRRRWAEPVRRTWRYRGLA